MKSVFRISALALTLLFVSGFTECYKPVTKSQMPAHIKTVAVPAFQNNALRFKIEHRFTEAVMRELIHRGHGLRVQSEREGADAVIDGVVKNFGFSGVLLDDKGRARIFEVTITAAVTVRVFGVRRQSEAATALFEHMLPIQSGVVLCLPPHST